MGKAALADVIECVKHFEAAGYERSTCKRTWRGIDYLLTSAFTAQLDMPGGVRWMVTCTYDAIEEEDRCSFNTGDQFFISRGDGYSIYMGWGFQKAPSSEMIARFDDDAAIRTTDEVWSRGRSRELYQRMMVGKVMRYRWYDWPNEEVHDGTMDISGFANAAALMEAIRGEFQIARVLKKIPAAR
ncbi:hypothetical protein ACFQ15_14955 [Sphingomonas hankookensis]|uniref:hypothetical protein n=1 Tax=Sphingomonas hankookensis TaxID=563996 RepID=UPI001F58965A|nr:hypothetical protein [Sphingomonas hankookensis]